MKRWPINKAYIWETAPFFRILLPFAAGVLVYATMQPSFPGAAYLIACITLLTLFFASAYFQRTNNSYPALSFVALTSFLFICGLSDAYFTDIRNDKKWFGHTINDSTTFQARITDNPVEKENSWKVPLAVTRSVQSGAVRNVTGNAFLYLYKDRFPMLLHKGDTLLLPGKWQPIKNAGNPFEFDYARYCRQNNLFYQQVCSVNDLRLYASDEPTAASVIDRCHDWCMQQLKTYIPDHKTMGLMQAMLLGDEINLDEDLRQSYADTGIVHIIAISGGNVAIFFLVISGLLFWLRDRRHFWVKYAIALPLVWFYVLMAGASPSAIRAAVMFSLLALSVMLQKNNSSLNTLLATGFLLLCAQPMWLFSTGFQLSFTAVLSLILFYAPVYRWLSPRYMISRLLWGTVAASIAAEVLTAPLVIYYFHIFPLLFIVANAAAYLFMGLVLILGIVIIALFFFPAAATIIGFITTWLVTVFDKIVIRLQGLNPASFHFLRLTGVEMTLLYVTIAGLLLFLMQQRKPAVFTALVAACLLLLSFNRNEWARLHQRRLIVYNVSKTNYIELITGSNYTVLQTDTAFTKKISYSIKPAHIYWGAWQQDSAIANELVSIGGKTALLLNREINTTDHFPVDYLIINYSGHPDAAELSRIFSPSLIIMGNNYTKKQQDKFRKECRRSGTAMHAIAEDGAFVIN
jgi:competence protein ComEC